MTEHHKPSEDELLAALESTLATEELTAFLSEWITTNVHRVTAFALVLTTFREKMAEGGFTSGAVEAVLPLMISRLWPESMNFTFTGETDDDEDDDGDDE